MKKIVPECPKVLSHAPILIFECELALPLHFIILYLSNILLVLGISHPNNFSEALHYWFIVIKLAFVDYCTLIISFLLFITLTIQSAILKIAMNQMRPEIKGAFTAIDLSIFEASFIDYFLLWRCLRNPFTQTFSFIKTLFEFTTVCKGSKVILAEDLALNRLKHTLIGCKINRWDWKSFLSWYRDSQITFTMR